MKSEIWDPPEVALSSPLPQTIPVLLPLINLLTHSSIQLLNENSLNGYYVSGTLRKIGDKERLGFCSQRGKGRNQNMTGFLDFLLTSNDSNDFCEAQTEQIGKNTL